jgi:hypothetical protein
MEKLPEMPVAKLTHTRNGMSNVNLVAANMGQQPGAGNPVDKFWGTTRFGIDIAAIQKALDEAKVPNIPQQPLETTFLRVILEREEMLPDGTWGKRTVVQPLGIQNVPPWPAANAQAVEWWTYQKWAQDHVADVLQPQFYQIVKGDQWGVPGEQLVDAGAAAQPFDPNQYIELTPEQIRTHVPPFTNEQKQKIYKAQQDRKKQEAAGKRGTGGTGRPPMGGRGGMPGGGMGPGGGGPDFGPNDTGRPPGGGYPVPGGGYPVPGGAGPGRIPFPGMGPDGEGEWAPGGNVVVNANFPLPPGSFNPQTWLATNAANATIQCWAHDDTVEPGHTYRYRVAYVIKNPVYGMGQFCKDPKLAEKFDLQSKFSEWSDKVEMLSTISFWVEAGPSKEAKEVSFQVFRWQSGDTKTLKVKAAPGDMVGKVDNNIDFGTGWTMVDLTWDQNKWYVLLMDKDGELHRRDATDMTNETYKKMKDQAGATSASASAAMPTGG